MLRTSKLAYYILRTSLPFTSMNTWRTRTHLIITSAAHPPHNLSVPSIVLQLFMEIVLTRKTIHFFYSAVATDSFSSKEPQGANPELNLTAKIQEKITKIWKLLEERSAEKKLTGLHLYP